SISALLAALTAVLGGAVLLSGRRSPAYRAFRLLCGNLLLWHLLNIYHADVDKGERLAYLSLGALAFLPFSLLGFLRTWLGLSEINSDSRASRGPQGPPSTALLLAI